MNGVTLHEEFTKRILRQLASFPALPNGGKVVLTLEFSCGMGGSIKEMEVKYFVNDKVRVG